MASTILTTYKGFSTIDASLFDSKPKRGTHNIVIQLRILAYRIMKRRLLIIVGATAVCLVEITMATP